MSERQLGSLSFEGGAGLDNQELSAQGYEPAGKHGRLGATAVGEFAYFQDELPLDFSLLAETDATELVTPRYGFDEGDSGSGKTSAEFPEVRRELIARCNLREYFLLSQDVDTDGSRKLTAYTDPSPHPALVYEAEGLIEQKLGEKVGATVNLLLREIRTNYAKFCTEDIKNDTDSGRRIAEVHRVWKVDPTDEQNIIEEIHLDYYDKDELTPETYNIYADKFGQQLELEQFRPEEVAADIRAPEEQGEAETPETEKDDVLFDLGGQDGLTIDLSGLGLDVNQMAALKDALAFGNSAETGSVSEGGRGIAILMASTTERSIRRYGPNGRGGHMHLVVRQDI